MSSERLNPQRPINYLVIIQARLGSTRFPNKIMQTVGGIPMVKRVWLVAKEAFPSIFNNKVIVGYPERYSDLDENNVLERFRRISNEFPSRFIVRLTADCPLISKADLEIAERTFQRGLDFGQEYYSNHNDGRDVQIFSRGYLLDPRFTDKEHVIADFTTPSTGLSVNTKEDLERVRNYVSR